MPKMKTKSGAKKRFRVTATGKIKRAHQGQESHSDQKTEKEKEQPEKGRIRGCRAAEDHENPHLQ